VSWLLLSLLLQMLLLLLLERLTRHGLRMRSVAPVSLALVWSLLL
jgi:hypothetical protein